MNRIVKYFWDSVRLNLTLSSFLALLAGIGRSIILLVQNRLSPLQYPNLSLFIVGETLGDYLLASMALAFVLSLVFGLRKRRELNAPKLLIDQTLFVLLFVVVLVVLKQQFTQLLSGHLAYLAFYTSRWVKENTILLTLIILIILLISFVGRARGHLRALISLKPASLCILVILGIQGIASAYHGKLQAELVRRRAPNVILLTIDALRADHLSLYGYPRNTSPHLDQLARESVVFTNANAAWTKTNQSFASILTGNYSYATGIGTAVASAVPRRNLLLSEILKNAGYHTAAMVSNANLSRFFNYSDGFENYLELWRKRKGPAQERSWYKADRVTREGIEWLKRNSSKKFFMWVHYIDPHTVYDPPVPYDNMFVNDAYYNQHENLPLDKIKPSNRIGDETDPDLYIARYDGAVRYTDEQIQLFLDKLDELGLRENTILIVTADHGESFVENRLYYEHGMFAYDNCARVPLLIRFPRMLHSTMEIDRPVSLVDIYPTLMDFLGVNTSPPVQGHSLRPSLSGQMGDLPLHVFIESDYQNAIRTRDWKLIYAWSNDAEMIRPQPFFELYDLKNDPNEKVNLADKGVWNEKELRDLLFSRLKEKRPRIMPRQAMTTSPDVDPATLEQLKSLGYIN